MYIWSEIKIFQWNGEMLQRLISISTLTTLKLTSYLKFYLFNGWNLPLMERLEKVGTCPALVFFINFSRQEHKIDVLYISFKPWDSQVSSYTPFYFSFTVPLRLLKITFTVPLIAKGWISKIWIKGLI